jgi:hypothetical protein
VPAGDHHDNGGTAIITVKHHDNGPLDVYIDRGYITASAIRATALGYVRAAIDAELGTADPALRRDVACAECCRYADLRRLGDVLANISDAIHTACDRPND